MKKSLALIFFLHILITVIYANESTNIKRDYYEKNFLDESLPLDVRIAYGDSLLSLAEDIPFMDYIHLGNLLYAEGRYSDSRDLFKRRLQHLPEDSIRPRLFSMWQVGVSEFTLRNYSAMLENAYALLKSPKPDSLRFYDLYACLLLCDYYNVVKKFNLAHKYQKMGKDIIKSISPSILFDEIKIKRFDVILSHCGVSTYIEEGKYDSAYIQLKDIHITKETIESELTNNISYALIAYKRGEPDVASYYYRQAIALDTHNFNRCVALIDYSQLLLDQENITEYRRLWEDNQADIAKIMHSPEERDYLENVARYQHLTGDFYAEAATRQRITELADSLYTTTLEASADALVNKFEFADIENTIAQADSRQRQSKVWIVVLSILAFILLGTGVWLWMHNRRRVRELQHIKKEKDEIGRLHDAEMERTRQSLELRSRELSSMALNMANLNEALDSILTDAVGGTGTDKERLTRIAKVIKDLERQDNIWEMFRTYFDTVHNSFSRKLFEKHPDLTNAEVRMCAFILMDLTTKEIATLTNRSARTVEVIKYNLRKKLSVDEPTSTYLKRLALL